MAQVGAPNVVYFGNLKDGLTDDALKAFAGKAGAVTGIDFAPRRRHAYVTYKDEASAKKAATQLNSQVLEERAVRVEASRTPKPREAVDPETVKTIKNRIVVRGLPDGFTAETLQMAFSSCGTVVKAKKLRDRGIVTFENEEAAKNSLSLNGTDITGKKIEVSLDTVRKRKPAKKAPKQAAAGASKPKAEAAPKAAPRQQTRVRVGGIAAGTSEDAVKAFFASAGNVTRVKTLKSNDYIVQFENGAEADKAITKNGASFNGAAITVALDSRRAAGVGARANADRTLWVSPLDGEKVNEALLRSTFGHFGAIESVTINGRNPATKYAYIVFKEASGADAAVAFNGSQILGTAVKAEKASTGRPRRNRAARSPAAAAGEEKPAASTGARRGRGGRGRGRGGRGRGRGAAKAAASE